MKTYIYNKRILAKMLIISLLIIGVFVTSAFAQEEDFKIAPNEYFTVKTNGRTVYLKYGGIVENSEIVCLNTAVLNKSKFDYSIDYDSSTVTINKSTLKKGDVISVSYYYKPNVAKGSGAKKSNIPMFTFAGSGSSLNFSMGYDSVDAVSGAVSYGTNLSSSLNGILNFNSHIYQSSIEGENGEKLSGAFNLHDMQLNMGNATLSLGYQDISSDFSGMNYIRSNSNIDGNLINQLEKEKGLKRNNIGLSYSMGENSSFNLSHDNVNDSNDSISNTAASYKSTNLEVDFSTSKVGTNFVRFTDIREADRESLSKEKGLERTSWGGKYNFGAGLLSYTHSAIKDSGGSIKNTAMSFASGNFELGYTNNNIDSGYSSFSGLREGDRDTLAKERGLDRTGLNAKYNFNNLGVINFSQNTIKNDEKKINSNNLSFIGERFELSMLNRNIEKGFGNYAGLARYAEAGQWNAEDGMKKSAYQLKYNTGTTEIPFWQTFYTANLKNDEGSLSTNILDLSYKNLQFGYASLDSNDGFNRMYAMDGFEKNRFSALAKKMFNYNIDPNAVDDNDRNSWGSQVGLDRKMMYSKYMLSPEKTLYFTQSNIDAENGGVDQVKINYDTKEYKIWYDRSSIDKTFNKLSSLTPIEKSNFNNQYGMDRSKYGFEGITKFGYFKYSDDTISDQVTDSAYTRNALVYATDKITLARRFSGYDDNFTRIYDISDEDRASQAANKGFDKYEYNINMKMGKTNQQLDLNAYFVDASKEISKEDIDMQLYEVTYKPAADFNAYLLSEKYNHKNLELDFVDNKKSVARLNKIFNFGNFKNMNFYSQYYTNSFLDSNKNTVNHEVMDFNLKSDQNQKFVLNLDYKSEDYDNGNTHKKYDIYANQKISDKFALTFGYGLTDSSLIEDENRLKYGIIYSVNDSFNLNYNIDTKVGGDGNDRHTQYVAITGLVPKILPENIINNLQVNFKYDTNKVKETRDKYDSSYKISGEVLRGALLMERSNVLEATNKQWYVETEKISYANPSLFGTPLSINVEQTLTTQSSGVKGDTDKYNLSYAVTDKFSAIYNTLQGSWNSDAAYIPVKTKEFGLMHKIADLSNITLKYTFNNNNVVGQEEEIIGLNYDGQTGDKRGKWSIYAGVNTSQKNVGDNSSDFSYNLSYEHKINKEAFLSLSTYKTTAIQGGTAQDGLNPESFVLGFRTNF